MPLEMVRNDIMKTKVDIIVNTANDSLLGSRCVDGTIHRATGLESNTIGCFNSMIEKQKKQDGGYYVSTVLFDNESEVLHDRVMLIASRKL